MGWGRTFFLGDIGNRLDIADAEQEIGQIKRKLAKAYHENLSQEEKINQLINENSELKLYVAAMVRLLRDKNVFSEADLEEMVHKIDESDGDADGKLNGSIL